mmetsp:Transcript_4060/g.5371  ORF Transcript_4060/g.5371 Transcript_4060/m.5371 type:complete len:153 (-) Transcript_4060:118-576(-)
MYPRTLSTSSSNTYLLQNKRVRTQQSRLRLTCQAKTDLKSLNFNRRDTVFGLVSTIGSMFLAEKTRAQEDGDNVFIQDLLKKSKENKAKNDAERFNYDKQYDSYMSIVKAQGFIPDNKATQEKYGISKPPECNLPVFNRSNLCLDFDKAGIE